jgi:hypothetical protein
MNKLKSLLSPSFIFKLAMALALVLAIGKGIDYIQGLRNESDRLHKELIGQEQRYQQLTEYVAGLEVKYKDTSELLDDAKAKFGSLSEELKGRVKIVSESDFHVGDKTLDNIPKETQVVEINLDGKNSPSIGYVLIPKGVLAFGDGTYPAQIKVELAVSQDENTGRYVVLAQAKWVQEVSLGDSKSWIGKDYPLKITGGTATIDPTERNQLVDHFSFWNPKMNANLDISPSGILPGVGMSFMSYGKSKADTDFRFLQLGLHFDQNIVEPTFTPILWRPFSGIISNTYIGPGVDFKENGVGAFLGVTVGF